MEIFAIEKLLLEIYKRSGISLFLISAVPNLFFFSKLPTFFVFYLLSNLFKCAEKVWIFNDIQH